MNELLGAHCFVSGGPVSAIIAAKKLNFNVLQIFSKNNNRWDAKELSNEEITLYKNEIQNSDIKFVTAHASYLINLANPDALLYEKSIAALSNELIRCHQLGIQYLVVHPGSHKETGLTEGIRRIAQAIDKSYEEFGHSTVKLLLETTAGQGSTIGNRFEDLRSIIDLSNSKDNVAVCLDTAHVWAAGYDITNKYDNVIKEFDAIIGLNLLQCIHINDSKVKLNSRVDRHEHIGKGYIGLVGFSYIMNDGRLKLIPKILETPKSKDQAEDVTNIKTLLSLIK